MAKRYGKTRTVYRTIRRYYSSARKKGGFKEKAVKFFAGKAAKDILGGGIIGLAGAYFIGSWEGVAGAFLGDVVENTLKGAFRPIVRQIGEFEDEMILGR